MPVRQAVAGTRAVVPWAVLTLDNERPTVPQAVVEWNSVGQAHPAGHSFPVRRDTDYGQL